MDIWNKIICHEGETFKTITGIEYSYVVYTDYILINNDNRRHITKEMFDLAMKIENPSPSKLQKADVWGPSYVYGIVTDKRIAP